MAVLAVMDVLRYACEKAAAGGLSAGTIIPIMKNGFTIMHEQAGAGARAGAVRGTGGRAVHMLLPSGDALESFFEQLGLGRLQEGKKLKTLSSLVLEVRRTR